MQKASIKAGRHLSSTLIDLCGGLASLAEGSVLDIGCGNGILGRFLRAAYYREYLVGVDVNDQLLKELRDARVYDDLVCCLAPRLPFRKRSFDTIYLIDVIEHLNKDEGIKLLREADLIARKRIIITTPTFRIVWQNPEHKSCWTSKEFKKLGYRVIRIRYRYHALNKSLPYRILLNILSILGVLIERFASTIIAIKEKTETYM